MNAQHGLLLNRLCPSPFARPGGYASWSAVARQGSTTTAVARSLPGRADVLCARSVEGCNTYGRSDGVQLSRSRSSSSVAAPRPCRILLRWATSGSSLREAEPCSEPEPLGSSTPKTSRGHKVAVQEGRVSLRCQATHRTLPFPARVSRWRNCLRRAIRRTRQSCRQIRASKFWPKELRARMGRHSLHLGGSV